MRAAGVTTDVISYNSALGALQASNRPGSDRAECSDVTGGLSFAAEMLLS